MVDGGDDGSRLADELAAKCIQEERTPTGLTAARDERAGARTPWIVALASLAIILVQIPSLKAALAPMPSLKTGIEAADAETEACIDTLWAMSAVLREGESGAALARLPFVEPVTRAGYTIAVADDGETVVDCPNPSVHGLRQLRVSSSAPVPRAVQ